MIKQYYKSIGVKKRKQDVIAFVNTVTQFIHRGSYAHIVTVKMAAKTRHKNGG